MERPMQIDALSLAEGLLPAVRQVMEVHEVTSGRKEQGFLARYRGRLTLPSEQAYERLEPFFTKAQTTLAFRNDGDDHVVLALPGVIRPRPSNPWINLGLFLLTVLSVMFAGALYTYQGPADVSARELLTAVLRSMPDGIPFAASLLAILLAHEFGHYLAARYHGTAVTLPYFIPFPGNYFGTMGAFIQLKEPPRNRKVLLDIGIAGPLAGLVVAIPVLILGLALSRVETLPASLAQAPGLTLEGNSILYLGLKYLVKGELLPAPQSYGGLHPALYWLRYLFLGMPFPFGGRDVILHPVAWAGWAGLLVTALNLIPVGQLDGGHTVFVLLGRRALRLWPIVIVALMALGTVWAGWWLWAALIFFLGRTYAEPLDDITRLDGKRKALAVLGLVVFFLVFTPVPLRSFFP